MRHPVLSAIAISIWIWAVTRAPSSTAAPDEIDWGIVNGLQWTVWCAFVALLFLCAALFTVILRNRALFADNASEKKRKDSASYFDIFMNLIMNDFSHNRLTFLPIRISYLAWLLAGLVFTSSCSGMVFSAKVLQKSNFPFTTLESFVQCLEKGHCRIVAESASVSTIQMFTAPGTNLGDRIGRTLLINPILIVPLDKIPEAISDEKGYYLVWIGSRYWFYYSTNEDKCRYFSVDAPFAGEEELFFATRF